MDMENHQQNGLYTPTAPRNEKWSHYFDEDEEEQIRQMSIHGNMQQVFTMSYVVSLIDTPGYKQYIKNFIRYICQSDVIILVFGADDLVEKPSFSNMPSTPNADKLAFAGYYQLLDKLRICLLFEIEQLIIVVNKLDKFNYSQRKFIECKSEIEKLLKFVGYGSMKDKFPIIPISAIHGDNILQKSTSNQKMAWWNDRKRGGYRVVRRQTFKRIGYALGYTVYDAIEAINYSEIKMYNKDNILNLKPFKMAICNVYDEIVDGSVVCGRVENGKISIGTMIKCVPSGSRGQIKSIETFHKKCGSAQYGDVVGISLDNFLLHPQKGDIMINESNTKEYEVIRFEAIIDVYPSTEKISKKYTPGKYNEKKKHFKGGFSPLIMTNNGMKCQCQLIHILWKLNQNMSVKGNRNEEKSKQHQQKLENATFVQAGDTGKLLFEPFRQFPISALQKIVILEHQQVVMAGKITKLHYADEVDEDFQ
eukprot:CAMPEP_0197049034 /NCGR_PEP_ID=MMETSP1384-20130603/24267_1 /TAXON_ID=29189 /ORGANISM="Ammonia sp." /LENGTH=476 /DNA_ID=CAMNT_0042481259 /DNA_START=160 /DNA_END=1590 /DNA_ORIENTATION=+